MTLTVMRTSEVQRNRVKDQEGLKLDAYLCTAGKWTIGYGHAETNPRPVRGLLNGEYYEGKPKKGVTINLEEAKRLFDADIDDVERQVSALVTVDLAQHQYDSLIDFVFQFGIGNLTGSTLIKKINFNPNNLGEEGKPGILDEFPRWARENGVLTEHVWRRSCRRACIYNGSPIPQALWRKNGFPFAVNKDDQIDYTITPNVHKIIAHGKKAAEKPVFDPAKPLPEPEDKPRPHVTDILEASTPNTVPIEVESLPLPEDELLLESVASPVGGSTVVTDSAPAKTDVASGSEAVRSAPPPVAPASVDARIVIPAEKPKAPPASVDTSHLRTDSMRVDQKPMEFSDRAAWFSVKLFGFWLKIMAGRGAIPLTAVSYYFQFFEDPFLSSVVISGGAWLAGECVQRFGEWKLSLHRKTASTALV